ncbi:nucleotide disphospho-sugar-binding domain-containing protein [Actinophytocola xanthii]|uniref:Uncharacterized protein n=1 Tax=Actinophytocola xanthii TaxID=1912961 RepID=A0A1Q8CS66_9PSEU|nr:nucleotide disphospho-sugar-binding domain-containing protein [Actinophytocola xanthii]OLF17190.1 hypothetical protein BU204_12390 [Actinophytocola xanthii]
MRVLFGASSWPGHYFPMVPLAWALRAAGHDVRMLCSPSDVDAVSRAGLVPVPVLDSVDMMMFTRWFNVANFASGDWPYPEPPPRPDDGEPLDFATFDAAARWAETAEATTAQLGRSIEGAQRYARAWRPDLVVHDMVCYEAPLAAEAVDVPNVLHLWGPTGPSDALDTLGGDGGSEQFSSATAESTMTGLIGPELGARMFGRARTVIDPCPEAVAPKLALDRLPIRYIPYNGPGSVPTDLPERTGRPRLCVVWGRSSTVSFGPASNRLPQIIAAAEAVGAEVLLLATGQDVAAVGPLPDSVRPMVEVPLHLVLPECDAVVHSGGGGVTMTSLSCGTPQLSLPIAVNAAVLSRRFDRYGAGLTVPNYEADVESLTGALSRLLTEPAFTTAARALAGEAETMPSPAEVVAELVELAGMRAAQPVSA